MHCHRRTREYWRIDQANIQFFKKGCLTNDCLGHDGSFHSFRTLFHDRDQFLPAFQIETFN